ncbi:MAG: iron ABC transporter permease [Planctomycetota bacterium]
MYWFAGCFALLVFVFGASVSFGRTGNIDLATVFRGIGAVLGFSDPLSSVDQARVQLRLIEAIATAGVGAALALSGSLLQGVFRNGLAAPSIIGVSSGASLGAAVAVVILGGYLPYFASLTATNDAPFFVAGASFLGALAATSLIALIATRHGRLSVPTLLLAGIAVNACCGGCLAAIQAVSLKDYEIARAIFAWTFGSLEDKSFGQAVLVWWAVLAAAACIPFVADELDLFVGGEEDAASLGVRPNLVKVIAVTAATLAAATAVAVAGQIAFVGLVVPHVLRLMIGPSHRVLLPFSIVGGALFLLGAQLLQVSLLGDSALRPGVLMSLIGGPFFIILLLTRTKDLRAWE